MSLPKRTDLAYDDEFKYDKQLEDRIPELMAQVESGPRHKQIGQEAKEVFCELFEGNVDSRKQFRWAMQEEFKMRRTGRVLHMNEFLHLLKKGGYNAWYSDKGGMAQTVGLYITHDGSFATCNHSGGEPHYVGFAQVPYMQEYEELYFDQYDVPLGSKRRGWRTLVLRMLQQGVLTEQKAHEIFGTPELSLVSRRYLETLKYFRSLK